ncbi:hypothetical protein B296_00050796 [Ensete ventricosum]|uniref:Uncharacterized protein n=1 Tax=Ensete ventricosum TaxID=4639 RepID=A0A426XRF6_ENSVE|nr:hypothetical protein B296_00050796 [Ensete ventricosum]
MLYLLPEIPEDSADHLMSYLSPEIPEDDVNHPMFYPSLEVQGATLFNTNARYGIASDAPSLTLRTTSRISSSIKVDLGYNLGVSSSET